ncbi:hypothetical protein WG936_09355 [Corynebacterium sp. H127]|uniref:hypothetical protein n=1 Tax=Corynebacterium sp. H127 TaxID=3133418 RepID=UPI0030A753CA
MRTVRWLVALGMVLFAQPAAADPLIESAETAIAELSYAGARAGLSSELRITATAEDALNNEVSVIVGSDPHNGPTVFTPDAEPTNHVLELYQDGTLRLVPRDQETTAVRLAPDFTADTGRPSSPGTVPIPDFYEYDPSALHPGLHDYCTFSPNYYVTPELNADFRGACANHDLCMEESLFYGLGYGWCNIALRKDMQAVCTSVYQNELEYHRQGCLDTADLYYSAVTLRHINRL